MKKYQALIVDDERGNRELLSKMLREHCAQIDHIALAQSVPEAERELGKGGIDVVFLDIEMPRENGFDLLNKLGEVDFKVIFVTAYDAYALRAIKYSALDYLLKPVDRDELIAAVSKLDAAESQQAQLELLTHNLQHAADRRIALATQDEVLFVYVRNIIRLQAEANYTKVYLAGEEPVLLSGNIGHFEKLLNDQQFFRSHQSHLVNLRQVKKYVKTDGGYLVMADNGQVPISRLKREEVKRLLLR
jgi:two-component system, LytTR family, response regulator